MQQLRVAMERLASVFPFLQFALGLGALIHQGFTSHLQEGDGQLQQHGKGGHRPGQGDVEPAPQGRVSARVLGPGMKQGHVGKAQGLAQGGQKPDALLQGIQQGQLDVRPQDPKGQAGKAGAGAHVDHLGPGGQQGRRQDAVRKMLTGHLLRLGDGGQVHAAVPILQHVLIQGKGPYLLRGQLGHPPGIKGFIHGLPPPLP